MLRPEHVSRGGLRRGRGGQIAGKPGFDAPSPPGSSPLPHPAKKTSRPAATLSDPQAPPLRRARCHVTTPPLKHRRNAGRRAAGGFRTSPPRPGPAGRGRVPRVRAGRGGGRRAEGGLGGGPERATKASAPVAVVPERAGAQFSGPREGWGGTRAQRCPPRPQAPPPAARSASGCRAPHRPARPPSPARGPRPARPPAPRSRSLALSLSPGLHLGSALPAPAPLPPHSPFPAPRRRRRRPHSPQLPIRAPPAVDLVSPQKSPVCYSRCGGVVTGWSPGVRERGPRLQRSCNPNPPSGGIFHTPMAPLQTWVRTALCWPRRLLPG